MGSQETLLEGTRESVRNRRQGTCSLPCSWEQALPDSNAQNALGLQGELVLTRPLFFQTPLIKELHWDFSNTCLS